MKQGFTEIPYRERTSARAGTMTISKSGRIGLPAQFIEEHDIASGDRARLYWNDATKALAVTFTTNDRKTAYPLAPTGGSEGRYISALKFFRAIGIDPSEYVGNHKYKTLDRDDAGLANVDANADVFVLSLDRPAAE